MAAIVTFDPFNKLIIEISTGGDNSSDVVEIYSEWKDWVLLGDNSKWPPAMRYVGGDPITGVQNLGSTFFLINGWRLRPAELNHEWELVGNLFTDPSGFKVSVPTVGAYTVLVTSARSNLVDSAISRLDLAQLQEAVYIDTTGSGVAGTAEGIGTPTNPSNNITDAYTIAIANNLRSFILNGSISLDRDFNGWSFKGNVSSETAFVALNGRNVNNTSFIGVTLSGTGVGQIYAEEVVINNVAGVYGTFYDCGLKDLMLPGANTLTTLVRCYSNIPGTGVPLIDLGMGTDSDLQIRDYNGGIEIRYVDVSTQNVSIDFASGQLVLHSTCSDGTIVVRGDGYIIDNSTGSLVVSEGLNDPRVQVDTHKILKNRQEINTTTNELVIYDDDGITPLYTFDLKNAAGLPSSTEIYKRVPQ